MEKNDPKQRHRRCFVLRKMLNIMKLTTMFFFLALFQVSAHSYAQLTHLTLKFENETLESVFGKIEKNSEFSIFYKNEQIKDSKGVSAEFKDASIFDILDQVLQTENLTYSVKDKLIMIVPKTGGTSELTGQQKKTVSGKVTDLSGATLPGVSVVVKGTTTGIITDLNGNYSISNIPENATLQFSFVGMKMQEIIISGKAVINVVLKEETIGIEEVVAVGYGTQRKKDITGSVSIVDMKAIKSIPSGSAIQAIQGQASGVNVISSGAPGGASNVLIRGITSFGNTQPLVLMDGVEANLNEISTTDIESVQVLKDAGAAAIYGVRGSNGVILVTTKKGKLGQPLVTYDAYFGIQLPLSGNPFNMLNSKDFASLSKIAFPTSELFKNGLPDYLYSGPGVSGTGMEGDAAVAPGKYNLDVSDPINNYLIQKVNKSGTDWFHEVFKPAPTQQHTLTVSGGTDKSNYLLALGYLNQQGTLMKTFEKRYSVRINTQYKIKKNIRVGENLYVYHNENPGFLEQSEGNTISNIYRQMPIIPVYDIAGNYGGMFAGPDLGNAQNPVAMQMRTINNKNNVLNVIGNVYAEIDLLQHFTARTSIGGSISNRFSDTFAFNRYNDREGSTGLNALTENSSYDRNLLWTNTLTYSKVFGKHNVKILAGTEANKYQGRSLEGGSTDFFSTDFDYLIIGNGASNNYSYSSAYNNTLFSLFSRLDYTYSDKYLLGATIRRDGSSKFGSDKRYGIFPSISIGWRVSQESFMKNVKFLNDLKIRGSYGILGSQNNVGTDNAYSLFGSSPRTSYYDITGSNTSAQRGFYQTRIGNSSTGWEENVVANIGFDATFFKSLDVSLEYYKKSINGLLFTLPLPATVGGATAPVVNIGDIQNKGVDISLIYRGNISKELNFNIGTSITTYKNLVVDIPSPGYFDAANSRNGFLVRNQVGQAVSSFFGYDVVSLFQSDQDVTNSPIQSGAAPGRFKYRDVNGDKKITSADRTFIGNPNPDFTYGLNLGLNYKDFDFSAIFYGSQGNDVLNLVKWYTNFFSGFRSGKSNDLLNAWTPQNTNTTIPKIEAAGSFSTSGAPNSFYIENGSFLKLKSLVLGYTLKPSTLKGINKLRLYVQATNLFTFTKYSGLDPELMGSSASFGIDYGNYPNNQKSFLFGLNISF